MITDAVWDALSLPDHIFDISSLLLHMEYFYHLKQRHMQALSINSMKVDVHAMM